MTNNLLLSSKQTNRTYVLKGVIIGIVCIALTIVATNRSEVIRNRISQGLYGKEADVILTLCKLLPIMPWIIGAVITAIHIRWSNAYINLYEKHIDGVVFDSRGTTTPIHLTYDDISNIVIKRRWIYIHTPSEIFKVKSPKAKKILSVYETLK